jgi:ActR/RegA family two-component response regulator
MKAPIRALVVEDIDAWVYILHRAVRRAGASEVVVCHDLAAVKEALRVARFDVAILDVGLDPDDDLNSDGVNALKAIREVDGDGTRCVLITGWQGGDRLDLQAEAQLKFGVDWAYMKEKYEAHTVIAKLTELLEQAPIRRLSQTTPMLSLCANERQFELESRLLQALAPSGGTQTLRALVSRLINSATPIIAMNPDQPMGLGPDGVWTGMYWSRALASAIAVGITNSGRWPGDEGSVPNQAARLLPAEVEPDLVESVRERNIEGRLWELPGFGRKEFPG